MSNPRILAVTVFLGHILSPWARAQTPPPATHLFRAQLGCTIAPWGRIISGLSGERSTAKAETAFGLAPAIDFALGRHLTIGLGVPILFQVKQDGLQIDSTTEIDILARLALRYPIASGIELYGLVAPGWDFILVPESEKSLHSPSTPGFFTLWLGVGATWDLSQRWFLFAEAGYKLGFFPEGIPDGRYPSASSYLHFEIGAGFLGF